MEMKFISACIGEHSFLFIHLTFNDGKLTTALGEIKEIKKYDRIFHYE